MGAAAQNAPAQFPAEQFKAGAALFAKHCQTCHGTRMRNPQWGADLKTFPRDARSRFVDSVTYGKRTMPPWEDLLSAADIDALWAYVATGDTAETVD